VSAIRTDGLTKDFSVGFWRKRTHRALDQLTLSVEPGEVFGFLGPNGAGKTTTLKLLMQLIFPTSGVAEILGRPAGSIDVRRRVGYLPETPYFYDNLTAEELLLYFAKLFGYAPADRRRRVDRLLDEVGIGPERRQMLRRFSKGMLQRVGVAQALVNDPEVVFLDEPMSGLDPIGRRQIRELILDLRRQGRTVFFSSHILADAESICSQAGVLVAGRLVSVGRVDEMLAFERGWELVVADLSEAAQQAIGGRARRITQIALGRHALEIAPTESDQFVRDCIESGAHIVALNPLHATLEEFFLRVVQDERGHEGAPSDDSRATEPPPAS
jgi:ABC-2 type transport system ATP-binding protein